MQITSTVQFETILFLISSYVLPVTDDDYNNNNYSGRRLPCFLFYEGPNSSMIIQVVMVLAHLHGLGQARQSQPEKINHYHLQVRITIETSPWNAEHDVKRSISNVYLHMPVSVGCQCKPRVAGAGDGRVGNLANVWFSRQLLL